MGILISWLVTTLAVLIAAYLLPGVTVRNFFAGLLTASGARPGQCDFETCPCDSHPATYRGDAWSFHFCHQCFIGAPHIRHRTRLRSAQLLVGASFQPSILYSQLRPSQDRTVIARTQEKDKTG